MIKVIHLIPYDGIGGVEVAARSLRGVHRSGLDFSVQSVYQNVAGYHNRQETFGLSPLFHAFFNIRAQQPDLLIVSLWRACLIGILVKVFRPRTRLVLMLHSTRNAHWLDKAITDLAASLATELWADSEATLRQRLKESSHKIRRVISFVTRRLEPMPEKPPEPTFIFWGRLNAHKRVDRAIHLFSRITETLAGARFIIIGPDGGAFSNARATVDELRLQDKVSFRGELEFGDICSASSSASFYLQTSNHEGMAMSVVEAMQLGLVPVVTPVGEIQNYCRHGKNAIVITTHEAAVQDVRQVLADPGLYAVMRAAAVATWRHSPIYADSMLDACESAMAGGAAAPVPK